MATRKSNAKSGSAAKAPSIKSALKEMQSHWEQGRDRAAGVPGGIYIARITKCDFNQAKSSGNWGTTRVWTVLNGEYAGSEIRDRITFSTEQGPFFTSQFIDQFGYEVPEQIEDLQEVFDSIVEEQAVARCEVIESGDFLNVRVQEVIDPDDLDELLEEGDIEDEDEEYEEEEDEEYEEEEEDADDEEYEDEEYEDEDADDEEYEDEDEDAEEEEEDEDPNHAALLEIAEAFDISEVSADMDIDDIVEVFNGIDWDRDTLEEEEQAVFEELGILKKPRKAAAKPATKPAAKAKAPAKGKGKGKATTSSKSAKGKSTSTKTTTARGKSAPAKGKATGRTSKRR